LNRNKIIKVLGIVFLVFAAVIYIKFFTSDTNFDKDEIYVQIPTGSNYQDVEKIISPLIKKHE
jgi:UPF0755 protein